MVAAAEEKHGSTPLMQLPASVRPPLHKPASRARPARQCPGITLPPAFEAFYALHWKLYLDYALAHLAETAATAVVRETFGELATQWPFIVSRLNPNAHAWGILTARTWAVSNLGVQRACSDVHYDALVLHRLLGYSTTDTADVMGEEPSKIRYVVTQHAG
ncbi:hypothetical protein [Streptomyces flavidovirens]|uniref:Uncharacterized protein n=1 Tax=Streptomyces flavidovirens TaxID=67298 RepID=A0ABW6RNL4_9ACTN